MSGLAWPSSGSCRGRVPTYTWRGKKHTRHIGKFQSRWGARTNDGQMDHLERCAQHAHVVEQAAEPPDVGARPQLRGA
jgi:hypothetical protein